MTLLQLLKSSVGFDGGAVGSVGRGGWQWNKVHALNEDSLGMTVAKRSRVRAGWFLHAMDVQCQRQVSRTGWRVEPMGIYSGYGRELSTSNVFMIWFILPSSRRMKWAHGIQYKHHVHDR